MKHVYMLYSVIFLNASAGANLILISTENVDNF